MKMQRLPCAIGEIKRVIENLRRNPEPQPGSNPGSGSIFFENMKTSVQLPNNLPAWSIQEGKGNLEIRFRWGGKFRALSSGTRSRRKAQSQAPNLIARWLQAHGQAPSQTAWEKAKEAFRTQEYADCKPTTWEGVETVLRRLQKVFSDLEGPHQLTPKVFLDRLKGYRGKAAPKYWAEILSITRKYCRWAVGRKLMASDVTEEIPYPDKKGFGRREKVWSDEYLAQVLEVLEPEDRGRILIMRWTGIDSGDLFTFDPAKHIVNDEEGNPVLSKLREKAKKETERIVQPLSSKVRNLMDRRWGEGFASIRSFTSSLRGRVQRAMSATSLPVMDLKSLRHTFATFHAERGVPIDVLSRWMGHAPGSTVLLRYYVHRRSTARYMD
jgi:integrase